MIQPYIYLYILFHTLFHYGLLQNTEYSSLCYAVGCYCSSMPYILYPNTTKLFIVFSTCHCTKFTFMSLFHLFSEVKPHLSLLPINADDLLENFPHQPLPPAGSRVPFGLLLLPELNLNH